MERIFNLVMDKPDERDYIFKASPVPLPNAVDLRPLFKPAVDQGYIGSCSGNALAGFREALEIKEGKSVEYLSRLFIYYYERAMNGKEAIDSGAALRDGIKVLAQQGVPPESIWPYIESRFATKPHEYVDAPALKYRVLEYHRVTTLEDLYSALAAGQPVVIGVTLWSSFYDTKSDGITPTPTPSKESILGGHAMVACGYKTINGERHVLCRNSWGADWGDRGYCWMPMYYQYGFLDMWTGAIKMKADDFTFKQAVDVTVAEGIFDGPEFWYAWYDKFLAGTLTIEDNRFVELAFRKFAADKVNGRLST